MPFTPNPTWVVADELNVALWNTEVKPLPQLPYLNLGCGRIILPAPRPVHHALIEEAIYAYPLWHNVDRNPEPGVDETVDIFRYPWPWADNSFDGALLTHICEHIPHEIQVSDYGLNVGDTTESDNERLLTRRAEQLQAMQDGWYAFFAELYRVLTPGAVAHILSPYAWSAGAVTDPTHTRLLTEHTFTHSMAPDPNSPFKYETGGIHFQMLGHSFGVYPDYAHLVQHPTDAKEIGMEKAVLFERALRTNINVVNDLMVRLKVIK